MSDPTSRALALLSLLQTNRFWSGAELVDHLGVSARTVRRDVDRLRELGYPVDATTGAAGGYRLAKGASLPPLLLDDDEAVAVAVGLRSAAGAAIAGIEDTSLRALAKLERVLPDRLRRRVNAIHSNVSTLRWNADGPVVDPEALAVLALACRDGEEVRFEYVAREGSETRRLVEPHQLVSAGRRWYLVAYDIRRNDWRTFRVDRLSHTQLAGARFAPRELPAASFTEFVSRSLSSARIQLEATVVAHCSAKQLDEFVKHSDATVTPISEVHSLVTIRADSPHWLLAMVTMLAGVCELDIQGPPEFVQQVRDLAHGLDQATARTTNAADRRNGQE